MWRTGKIRVTYRVIHKSLRNFRTRLRNNQDRHSRKELWSTCKVGQCLSLCWHALSLCWHALSLCWHALSLCWHALSLCWHALSLCWHAPLRRDHPGYCTAEVGDPGGTYELLGIATSSSKRRPASVNCNAVRLTYRQIILVAKLRAAVRQCAHFLQIWIPLHAHLVITITSTQLVSVATAVRQWRYCCCYFGLQEIKKLTLCVSPMTHNVDIKFHQNPSRDSGLETCWRADINIVWDTRNIYLALVRALTSLYQINSYCVS
jgi:hypothetical protein